MKKKKKLKSDLKIQNISGSPDDHNLNEAENEKKVFKLEAKWKVENRNEEVLIS